VFDIENPEILKDLRQVLVIRKGIESSHIKLISGESNNHSKAVKGLFDAGMSRVGFKEQNDLDLSTLSLNGEYFTIIVEGFSEAEISAKDLGDFDGVFVFESSNLRPSVVYNTWEIYSLTKTGETAGNLVGMLLVPEKFTNLEFRTPIGEVFYIEDRGTAEGIYQSKGTVFGKDSICGISLVSAYINGRGVSEPYLLEEIRRVVQTLIYNNRSKGVTDENFIERNINSYIKDNYVDLKLIESSYITNGKLDLKFKELVFRKPIHINVIR
jgi:hypothetical protein